MTYYYTLITIFTILAYVMIVDENVGLAINLILKIIKSKCIHAYFYIWLHPKNPIFRYLSWRRSWKLAEQLQKEINSNK
jgi:hypothetical protein